MYDQDHQEALGAVQKCDQHRGSDASESPVKDVKVLYKMNYTKVLWKTIMHCELYAQAISACARSDCRILMITIYLIRKHDQGSI